MQNGGTKTPNFTGYTAQQLNIQMVQKNGIKTTNSIEQMAQQLNIQMAQNIGFKTTNSIEQMAQRLNGQVVQKKNGILKVYFTQKKNTTRWYQNDYKV